MFAMIRSFMQLSHDPPTFGEGKDEPLPPRLFHRLLPSAILITLVMSGISPSINPHGGGHVDGQTLQHMQTHTSPTLKHAMPFAVILLPFTSTCVCLI